MKVRPAARRPCTCSTTTPTRRARSSRSAPATSTPSDRRTSHERLGRRQTVQVTVPEEPAADRFTFDYTVNNGTTAKNGRATAKVTVTIVGPDVNTAPKLRAGSAKLAKASYPVARNATGEGRGHRRLARCRERPAPGLAGRPGRTGVDGAGALIVRALGKKGDQEVEYKVSDSNGGVTTSTATVQVLGDDDRAVPPRTRPDVLRGVVGKPVQLQPLGNDIPGADPTDPEAACASPEVRPGAADHRHEHRHRRPHRDRRRRERQPSRMPLSRVPGSASVACGRTSCPTPTRSCRPSRHPTRRWSVGRPPSSRTCCPTTTARAATCSSSSGS